MSEQRPSYAQQARDQLAAKLTPEFMAQHYPTVPVDLRAVETALTQGHDLSDGFSEAEHLELTARALLAVLRETHAILGAARSWLADNCPVAVEVACDTVLAKVKDE